MSPQSQGIGSRVGAAAPASVSKRRREVLVAGHRAPASVSSTRGRHMRRLLATRKYIWGMTIVGGAVFLLGASTGRIFAAVIPPLIVIAVAIGLVWREATRLAQRDFFAGFALDHQFDYSERMSLIETTPLLSAGDRRHCEHYMEGELEGADGIAVALAHFVYETRSEYARRRHRAVPVYAPHEFTIAVVDVPRAAKSFPGLYLSRQVGKLAREDWLPRDGLERVELDNQELSVRYDLLIDREQERARVRDLFKSTFQTWLAGQPRPVCFEYSDGTLVVYVPKRAKDADTLYWLIDCARWIAKRLEQESKPIVEIASTAPPTGVSAFPPPPPATKPRVAPTLASVPEPEVVEAPAYVRASVPPPSAH